ncbi:NADP-dependent oxidoreductase domain-containing protein [Xylogone sp. PMI_703]|nr:NADP-dependent oxidoreductase domain-containing protein [Xylogone sp. PMI_703]
MANNLRNSCPEPKSLLGYYRQLAPNAAVKVSPICLGGMNFGDAWKDIMGVCDKNSTFELLEFFYSHGGNFIDTASNYQNGESEQWIGEWMKQRGNRDEMVIATKYTSAWRLANEGKEIQANYGGNNKKALHVSVEGSLRKLQTSYIDILYVHTWDFTTSIPELMNALHNLVVASKVLYLGVSNTPAWVVVKANEYARQKGLTPFSIYQGPWSAAERAIERDVIPMCQAEGMAVTPFGTLGSGYFKTAAQRAAAASKPKEGRDNARVDIPEKIVVAEALEKVANAKNVSITSIALAYIMHKAPYVFPILGGRNVNQLKANIDALSIKLSPEEISGIESAVPFDFGYPQSFLGGPGGARGPGDVWMTRAYGRFDWVEGPKPIEPHGIPK